MAAIGVIPTVTTTKKQSRTVSALSTTAVWVKADGVQFSEMRSGLKMVSPPGFLCNTDEEIQCILICFQDPKL